MRIKSLISVCLAFTILASSFPAVAEDDFIDKLNNFQDGQGPIHKNIARPITRYALKKMGTPGFVISKYMTFRKHLNQPTCPLSKQIHFYANMLNLAGDITNYVLTIKHSRDLRKEFSQKSEAMTAYLSSTKDLLKAPRESGEKFDVQLMALDYSIKSEELNLERQKIKRMFTYPAISMIFIASIMNAQEALATTTSLGATAASENSCLSKDKIRREKENTAAQKIADEQAKVASEEGAKDPLDPPWYIKPFMWLAGKGREIGDGMRKIGRNIRESEVSKFANENRKALDTAREKNIGEYGGIGPLNSANYCDEMIVGLISGMKKQTHRLCGKSTRPGSFKCWYPISCQKSCQSES